MFDSGPRFEIPGIGVVGLEVEVRVRVLVRLLVHRVFERVALAQRAVAMVVVVHPLIGGRRLLRDRLQRRMRTQQRHRRGQAVVGDAEHADLAVVVRRRSSPASRSSRRRRSSRSSLSGSRGRPSTTARRCLPIRTGRAGSGRRRCSRRAPARCSDPSAGARRRSPARRTACGGTGSAAARRALVGVKITVSSLMPSRTGTITLR